MGTTKEKSFRWIRDARCAPSSRAVLDWTVFLVENYRCGSPYRIKLCGAAQDRRHRSALSFQGWAAEPACGEEFGDPANGVGDGAKTRDWGVNIVCTKPTGGFVSWCGSDGVRIHPSNGRLSQEPSKRGPVSAVEIMLRNVCRMNVRSDIGLLRWDRIRLSALRFLAKIDRSGIGSKLPIGTSSTRQNTERY